MRSDTSPSQTQGGANPAVLARELTDPILSVPGVVDLAPTLTGRSLRAGGKMLGAEVSLPGQGIEVSVRENGVAVAVDVTALVWRPTLATAGEVQRVVQEELAARGLECTSVTVSVITLSS